MHSIMVIGACVEMGTIYSSKGLLYLYTLRPFTLSHINIYFKQVNNQYIYSWMDDGDNNYYRPMGNGGLTSISPKGKKGQYKTLLVTSQ